MTDNEKAQRIFERWSGELVSKNKGWNHIDSNFEELFEALSDAEITLEIAEEIKKDAIQHHLPSDSMIKYTYKTSPQHKFKSEKEYGEDWKKGIEGKANAIFYLFYKIEGETLPKEKKYGNMSKAEYLRLQQRADSFPTLDIAKLKAQLKQGGSDEI